MGIMGIINKGIKSLTKTKKATGLPKVSGLGLRKEINQVSTRGLPPIQKKLLPHEIAAKLKELEVEEAAKAEHVKKMFPDPPAAIHLDVPSEKDLRAVENKFDNVKNLFAKTGLETKKLITAAEQSVIDAEKTGRTLFKKPISSDQALRNVNQAKWMENANQIFKNEDGGAKVWYRGTQKDPGVDYSPTRTKYGGRKFYTSDPDFADEYANGLTSVIRDSNNMRPNIAPVHINAEKVFDPRDVKMLDNYTEYLVKKYPDANPIGLKNDSYGMRARNNGWRKAENNDFYDYLDRNGFDGSIVFEEGKLNFMGAKPENIKSPFNSGKYKDPKDIMNTFVPIGAGLGGAALVNKDRQF